MLIWGLSFYLESNSLSKDTLVYLSELTIRDTQIYPILDKTINYEIDNFRRNNTFWIVIFRKTDEIYLSICYIDKRDVNQFYSKNIGFLFYRDNMFYVILLDDVKMDKFFKKTNIKKSFIFEGQNDLIFGGTENEEWIYLYKNEKYILIEFYDPRKKNCDIVNDSIPKFPSLINVIEQ